MHAQRRTLPRQEQHCMQGMRAPPIYSQWRAVLLAKRFALIYAPLQALQYPSIGRMYSSHAGRYISGQCGCLLSGMGLYGVALVSQATGLVDCFSGRAVIEGVHQNCGHCHVRCGLADESYSMCGRRRCGGQLPLQMQVLMFCSLTHWKAGKKCAPSAQLAVVAHLSQR